MTPSVLDTSCVGLRGSVGLISRTNTRRLRVSIVSNAFIPDVSCNPNFMGTVHRVASVCLSIRVVIRGPRRLVPTVTRTNTSGVNIRIRTAPRVRHTLRLVGGTNGSTRIMVGPKAPIRVVGPILRVISRMLMVAIGPNFNNRGFLPRAITGVTRLSTVGGTGNCSFSVRVSNKVGGRAIISYCGTNTAITITNSCICGTRSPLTHVRTLHSTAGWSNWLNWGHSRTVHHIF